MISHARKRGVKSPDPAEAVMLAYAQATPGIIEFYRELAGQGGSDGGNGPNAAGGASPIAEPGFDEDGGELMEVYRKALEEAEGLQSGDRRARSMNPSHTTPQPPARR